MTIILLLSAGAREVTQQIRIITWNGTYLMADGGGGGPVNANSIQALTWETFILVNLTESILRTGDVVALRTLDGRHYLSAYAGGGYGLTAEGTWPGPWEQFVIEKKGYLISRGDYPYGIRGPVVRFSPGINQLEIQPGDAIALRTTSGHYLVAEDGGGSIVNANRQEVREWETFELEDASATKYLIHLETWNNHYMVAEEGGGGPVNANRPDPLTWETFTLIDGNGGVLRDGDWVYVRTFDGAHYLTAQAGGGREVNAEGLSPNLWQRFWIRSVNGSPTIRPGDAIALQASDGHYLVAEDGGGSIVNANRQEVREWETFHLLDASESKSLVRLGADYWADGYFVAADFGGGAEVRRKDGSWGDDAITLIDLNGGPLMSGDLVHLRTADGFHYVGAEGGGGGGVKADGQLAYAWQTFVIQKINDKYEIQEGAIAYGDAIALQTATGHYLVRGGPRDAIEARGVQSGSQVPWESIFRFLNYEFANNIAEIAQRIPGTGMYDNISHMITIDFFT
jgi:hypothetical protein